MMESAHRVPFVRSLAVLTGLLVAGCAGGPERTPHTPVKGVDTEDNRVENPYDAPEGPGRTAPATLPDDVDGGDGLAPPVSRPSGGGAAAAELLTPAQNDFLAAFADDLAAAHRQQPGVVAIFPGLTRASDRDHYYVSGLGEHLMSRTAAALRQRGVTPVVHGPGLRNDIRAKNRDLDSLRGPDDVFWLADEIGADYAVFGVARVQRVGRESQLEIDWSGMRMAGRDHVAGMQRVLTGGPLAQHLYRLFETPSDIAIGPQVEFTPSASAELAMVGQGLVRRAVQAAGAELDGKTVTLLPFSGGSDLSAQFGQYLTAATGGRTRVIDREIEKAALQVIEAEVAQARDTGSIPEETLATLQRDGSDFAMTGGLRAEGEGYALGVTLINLSTGVPASYRAALDPRVKPALDGMLSRL